MADIVVQGDTGPDVVAVLHEEGSVTSPIDLTGATVAFQMRKPDDRRYTVNALATIEDATAGQVRYEWGPNDLAVPGDYQAQFEITFPNGKVQTTKTPLTIEVRRQ
jgi:Rib/alpha/Esp surface antigen-like repeat protein